MKPIVKISAPLMLLLAGAWCWQRQTVTGLQRESDSLNTQAQEARQLTVENRRLQDLGSMTNPPPEFARADLLRLRNEVRELRTRLPELETRRSEVRQLTEAFQAGPTPLKPLSEMEGYVARATWANAGQLSPEATVRSFFSAMAETDLERFVRCWEPKQAAQYREQIDKDPKGMQETLSRDLEGLKRLDGYRVASQETRSDGAVTVGIQAAVGGETWNFRLRLYDGEWKMEKALEPSVPTR